MPFQSKKARDQVQAEQRKALLDLTGELVRAASIYCDTWDADKDADEKEFIGFLKDVIGHLPAEQNSFPIARHKVLRNLLKNNNKSNTAPLTIEEHINPGAPKQTPATVTLNGSLGMATDQLAVPEGNLVSLHPNKPTMNRPLLWKKPPFELNVFIDKVRMAKHPIFVAFTPDDPRQGSQSFEIFPNGTFEMVVNYTDVNGYSYRERTTWTWSGEFVPPIKYVVIGGPDPASIKQDEHRPAAPAGCSVSAWGSGSSGGIRKTFIPVSPPTTPNSLPKTNDGEARETRKRGFSSEDGPYDGDDERPTKRHHHHHSSRSAPPKPMDDAQKRAMLSAEAKRAAKRRAPTLPPNTKPITDYPPPKGRGLQRTYAFKQADFEKHVEWLPAPPCLPEIMPDAARATGAWPPASAVSTSETTNDQHRPSHRFVNIVADTAADAIQIASSRAAEEGFENPFSSPSEFVTPVEDGYASDDSSVSTTERRGLGSRHTPTRELEARPMDVDRDTDAVAGWASNTAAANAEAEDDFDHDGWGLEYVDNDPYPDTTASATEAATVQDDNSALARASVALAEESARLRASSSVPSTSPATAMTRSLSPAHRSRNSARTRRARSVPVRTPLGCSPTPSPRRSARLSKP